MELLSPAGNVQKLELCYLYGADAAYIGLKDFSLRVKADNFYAGEHEAVRALKERFPGKKLYCALNISFHNAELDRLQDELDYFRQYPIDAFIVQDLGVVPLLQREFPHAALHLSTQASCMNREAVRMYRSMGFTRVVMGREASLAEIAQIKDAVPDMELECFVHGAMCIAYSGRCLMSAYINGRSAQQGFCSHTCRWDYDVLTKGSSPYPAESRGIAQSGDLLLREHKRPDEYFPVYEGERFTAVLSSKDLCLIDRLKDFSDAGVDSLKIEGRMKSVLYVAMVTQAYRAALDCLGGGISPAQAEPLMRGVHEVSHRPYTHGFYYDSAQADVTVSGASDGVLELLATVGQELGADEEDAVFVRAQSLAESRRQRYQAMVPQARAAYDRSVAEHPDSCLPVVKRHEGWRMYALDVLNRIDGTVRVAVVSPGQRRAALPQEQCALVNPATGEQYRWVSANHPCVIYAAKPFAEGTLLCAEQP